MKTVLDWLAEDDALWIESPDVMVERIQRDAFIAGVQALLDGAGGQVQRAIERLPQTTISETGVRAVFSSIDVEQLAEHAFPMKAAEPPAAKRNGQAEAGAA